MAHNFPPIPTNNGSPTSIIPYWKMLFPTSIILSSEPIFHAALRVLFKALWFCCLSENSFPNRLSDHSSKRSTLLWAENDISASSSLVRQRFWRLFTTSCSMASECVSKGGWDTPLGGENTLPKGRGEKALTKEERENCDKGEYFPGFWSKVVIMHVNLQLDKWVGWVPPRI